MKRHSPMPCWFLRLSILVKKENRKNPYFPKRLPMNLFKRFASCTHFRRNRRVEEYHNCQYKYELESNSG